MLLDVNKTQKTQKRRTQNKQKTNSIKTPNTLKQEKNIFYNAQNWLKKYVVV